MAKSYKAALHCLWKHPKAYEWLCTEATKEKLHVMKLIYILAFFNLVNHFFLKLYKC